MTKLRRHKYRKKEFAEIEYKPTSVKDLLTEMKDISELIVDLAYSAVKFDSEDMAKEVRELEFEMDKLLYQIRLAAMLAARTPEDAAQLSGILQVAAAAENISNAAGDIAELLDSKIELRPFLPFVLKDADEKILPVKILEGSSISRYLIGELRVESETGAKIIAVKRNKKWIYDVERDFKLKPNDTLIVRGVEDGLLEFKKYAEGKLKWPNIYELEEEGE